MKIHCLVAGDLNVGKTSLVRFLLSRCSDFMCAYELHNGEQFPAVVNCAIVMFDLLSIPSYWTARSWCMRVQNNYPGIPIVMCANKLDDNYTATRLQAFREIENIYPCYGVSLKSNYNCDSLLCSIIDKFNFRY